MVSRQRFRFMVSGLGFRDFGLFKEFGDEGSGFNVGALISRTGFGGILYYKYNGDPENPTLIIKALTLGFRGLGVRV